MLISDNEEFNDCNVHDVCLLHNVRADRRQCVTSMDRKAFHNKNYRTLEEESLRYAIWKENLEIIKRHNEGKHSFTMVMNHLGDMVGIYRTVVIGRHLL